MPLKNLEERREYQRQWAARWRADHRAECNERALKYYHLNPTKSNQRSREWTRKNLEKRKAYNAAYYASHPVEYAAHRKNYLKTHQKEISAHMMRRYHSDPMYRLKMNLRARIADAFRVRCWHKNARSPEILGTDMVGAKTWIESQFKPGMSWENRHLWHIDHKVPLCSANTPEELIKLCHHRNLQPLWEIENRRKAGKQEAVAI